MKQLRIVLGADHAGVCYKKTIIDCLEERGVEIFDVGTYTRDAYDYPAAAKDVCAAILEGKADRGILICGTGIGVCIAANRHNGIRAALCTDTFAAKSSISHNNANVLCLGARITGESLALEIVDAWLKTEFDPELGAGRHKRRVDMIEEQV